MIRSVTVMALLLIATAAPLSALEPLIESGVWGRTVAAALASAVVVLVILRTTTGWVVWPTVIAIIASSTAVLAMEYRAHEESLSSVVSLAVDGATTLRTHPAPIVEGAGVAFLVATVVALLFISAEALAVGADSPALAGAPLLLLWTPHAVLDSEIATWLILVAASAYIFTLVVAGPARRLNGSVVSLAVAVTALTIVSTMVLSPLALSSSSWVGGVKEGSATRLDLGLDIRSDLLRGKNTPLIYYQGLSPAELGPVHSHTLADFDGRRWQESPEAAWLETSLLYPEGAPDMRDPDSPDLRVTIRIDHLAQERLFLPEAPRQTHHPMLYAPLEDGVHHPAGSAVSYGLFGPDLISDPEVWDERSRSDRALADAGRYLEVPQTSRAADIEALTEEIVEGAASPYEKAVAIQNFFRTDARFEYTTSVPSGSSDDAVWEFLEHGQGYCVQFATAMVILARTAGIPARMAVGFLPGESATLSDGESGGVISSHDAHTWPQLFLGDAGWARFEPTPASRSGPAPEFAAGLPVPETPEVPEETPDANPTTADESPTPHESTSTPPAAAPGTDRPSGRWPMVAAMFTVAAGGIGGWVWHRRRQRSRERRGPEEFWNDARAALRARGLEPDPADTPSSVLSKALDLAEDAQWHADLAGFGEITAVVNRSRYARTPPSASHDDLEAWLAQTREAVRTRA